MIHHTTQESSSKTSGGLPRIGDMAPSFAAGFIYRTAGMF